MHLLEVALCGCDAAAVEDIFGQSEIEMAWLDCEARMQVRHQSTISYAKAIHSGSSHTVHEALVATACEKYERMRLQMHLYT
jgi:uncharacterized OsmC-like protein